jgi:hypothetical protein
MYLCLLKEFGTVITAFGYFSEFNFMYNEFNESEQITAVSFNPRRSKFMLVIFITYQ